MLNVFGGLCFVGFLLAALGVRLAERAETAKRRRRVNAYLAYAVAASFAAGLSQKDAWPFAKWPMAGGRADARGDTVRIVAVDAEGTEHEVDYRAWQPMAYEDLVPWVHRTFTRLPRDAQDQVAAHLLARAERARQRAAAGSGPGYAGRILGPLAAPEFDLHPRPWSAAARVPARPLVALRVYRETWDQEERRRDPSRFARQLLYESPR